MVRIRQYEKRRTIRLYYSIGDHRVTELLDLARDVLHGSEVYLMTCDVIGDTDENPANVTG